MCLWLDRRFWTNFGCVRGLWYGWIKVSLWQWDVRGDPGNEATVDQLTVSLGCKKIHHDLMIVTLIMLGDSDSLPTRPQHTVKSQY